MEPVIVDTGFWLAIFDPKDQHHLDAGEKEDRLKRLRIVLPWPTLYETLRTRFVRNKPAMDRFERLLKRPGIEYFDDSKFREKARDLTFDSSLKQNRPLSMDDCLIRLVIDDPGVRVRYLATFNQRDFYDVCRRRQVEII